MLATSDRDRRRGANGQFVPCILNGVPCQSLPAAPQALFPRGGWTTTDGRLCEWVMS